MRWRRPIGSSSKRFAVYDQIKLWQSYSKSQETRNAWHRWQRLISSVKFVDRAT